MKLLSLTLLSLFLTENAFSHERCTDLQVKILDEAKPKIKKQFLTAFKIGECHDVKIYKENSDTEFCIANVKLDTETNEEPTSKNLGLKFFKCETNE